MPLFLVAAVLAFCVGGLICYRYFSLKRKYTLSRPSSQKDVKIPLPVPDFEGFVRRFSRMIQIPTISWTDLSKRDESQFIRFQEELVDMYPKVHQVMTREVCGPFGLIYHWKGRNPGKKPILFLAHYDVVPAEEKGTEIWEQPPFSAAIKSGILWGRGTLDIKCQLAFQMESAETLIGQGWSPDQDIYFAFGGDEEISGMEGAGNMAALLKERGLEFEFIMDEGGVIAQDQLSFLQDRPAALIGLAEKGFATFQIRATGESGHSSMPALEGTAIGRLARGIVRLEKKRFPWRLDPVMANMLERFVPYVSPGLGLIFANLWLTRPLILFIFSKARATDSLIRTTRAVTVCGAGEQENVLPSEASCLVNHRILPGEDIDGVRRYNKRILNDPGLEITRADNWLANDPLPATGLNGSGFGLVENVLARTHPDAIAVPFLVNGSTDSKHYRDLTKQILRFTPLVLTPGDVASIHGINEKVSLENLEKGLEFYLRLFCHL